MNYLDFKSSLKIIESKHNPIISICEYSDYDEIVSILANEFNMSIDEMDEFLLDEGFDINLSVKAEVDGKIVGILANSLIDINNIEKHDIIEMYKNFTDLRGSGFQGIAFWIDERYRGHIGHRLDLSMLRHSISIIPSSISYIWIQVYVSLNTHYYWQRMGFRKFAKINDGYEDVIVYYKKLS